MISDPEKAAWAVAYAMQTRTKRLAPALRRAYEPCALERPGPLIPDRDAITEALQDARSIVRALEEALRLLGATEAVGG